MNPKINSPELKEEYHSFLLEKGVSLGSRTLTKRHWKRVCRDMLETARAEGQDSWKWTERMLSSPSTSISSGNYNELILDICGELDEALSEMEINLDVPVFAGEFPTGLFNAQARPVQSGLLVLINTGLFDFFYRFWKLYGLSMQFSDNTGKIWTMKKYGHDASDMLADCLLSYLLYGDVCKASYIPPVGGLRGTMMTIFLRDCERFAIAHELGHVINGDCASEKKLRWPLKDEMEFCAKEHRQEFAADSLAAKILLYASTLDLHFPGVNDKTYRSLKVASAAMAPFVFFALDKIVTEAAITLFDIDDDFYSDHPKPEERIAMLKQEIIEKDVGEILLQTVEATIDWTLEQGEHAINKLMKKVMA